MFPASSRLHLQTSFPFRTRWPRGTAERGTRTKTLRSSSDLSSSRPPAIQYSRSSEARASAQEGSSLSERTGVAELEARAASTRSTEGDVVSVIVTTGMRTWESQKGVNSAIRAGACERKWAAMREERRGAVEAVGKLVGKGSCEEIEAVGNENSTVTLSETV
jgi:hypothetical protein